MNRQDMHIHTLYSDGENAPEDIIKKAIGMGLDAVGFSDHSHTCFDETWCMKKGAASAYKAEIASLAEKYRDKINVLCGVEQDFYSGESTEGFDYVIGAVHYIKVGDEYIPVDESPEILKDAAERLFGGDMYSLCEEYYRTVKEVCEVTGAHIVGHFDLITKFLENEPLFSTDDPRYRAAWQDAADMLLVYRVPFEINTGAMYRGYRTSPYPSEEIRDYIREHGGSFILSSDSHSADCLCYRFSDYEGETEI